MDFSHPHKCTKSLAGLSIALSLGYPGLPCVCQASGSQAGQVQIFSDSEVCYRNQFFPPAALAEGWGAARTITLSVTLLMKLNC